MASHGRHKSYRGDVKHVKPKRAASQNVRLLDLLISAEPGRWYE